MLNLHIINNGTYISVKWIFDKDSILVHGKDYCSCKNYRLNNEKQKVRKLMQTLLENENKKLLNSNSNIKDKILELHEKFLSDTLDFNIVVEKSIIDNRIPIDNIVLKNKHVIIEENDFLGKFKEEFLKVFQILPEYIENLSKEEKTDFIKEMESHSNTKDKSKEEVTQKERLDNLIKHMKTPDIKLERFKAVNNFLKDINNSIEQKSNLGKSNINNITSQDRDGVTWYGPFNVMKKVDNIEEGGMSKLDQVNKTLERVRKNASYDLSVNNEPTFILKLGKDTFLFNNIEVYYKTEDGKYHNYYLHIDQNGMMQSNIEIRDFELFLLKNSFYNVIDFTQQRFLSSTNPSMVGMVRIIPDIVLLVPNLITSNFPKVEKLGNVKSVYNFDRLISPSHYRELVIRKGEEKRYDRLLTEQTNKSNIPYDRGQVIKQNLCYVDFVNNAFTFSNKKIENQELFRISLAEDIDTVIDGTRYLSNLIGSVKGTEIFVLTKNACQKLKVQIGLEKINFIRVS